ncbi:MAG: class I SAM-dependent methyltransferase [bacterium]|jgi:SAM-dependent methyltransferase
MKTDFVTFRERRDRVQYLARTFEAYLRGRILDVGCDQAYLKTLIPELDYCGVDIAGNPDIQLNLEQIERLPFDDNQFDCVVCNDVLEHLDNFHFVFGELLRVSRKYVIISLPNCWIAARSPIARGYGSFTHYGLPLEPPPDRHKWFFNITEARHFMVEQAKVRNFRIPDTRISEKPRNLLLRFLRRIRFAGRDKYINRYAHTVWFVLQKD